jgi:hypothetical protein
MQQAATQARKRPTTKHGHKQRLRSTLPTVAPTSHASPGLKYRTRRSTKAARSQIHHHLHPLHPKLPKRPPAERQAGLAWQASPAQSCIKQPRNQRRSQNRKRRRLWQAAPNVIDPHRKMRPPHRPTGCWVCVISRA